MPETFMDPVVRFIDRIPCGWMVVVGLAVWFMIIQPAIDLRRMKRRKRWPSLKHRKWY